MSDKLRLDPSIYLGSMLAADRESDANRAIQYIVRVLPISETAIISDLGGRWRIQGDKGVWAGDYDDPETALAAPEEQMQGEAGSQTGRGRSIMPSNRSPEAS